MLWGIAGPNAIQVFEFVGSITQTHNRIIIVSFDCSCCSRATPACYVGKQTQQVSAASGEDARITLIQKVLELLNGMLTKGNVQKQGGMQRFTEFQHWCERTQFETNRNIKVAADTIVELQAEIEKAVADQERLGNDIKELDSSVDASEAAMDKAKAERKKEHNDYVLAHVDCTESINAIERAVMVLEVLSVSIKQASFLDLRKVAHRPALSSFLQARQ